MKNKRAKSAAVLAALLVSISCTVQADEAAQPGSTRQTKPGTASANNNDGRLEHLQDTINALTAALERISKESGKNINAELNDIRGMVKKANSLAAENNYAEARKVLDQAFKIIKTSIASFKQGTTVIAQKDTSPKGIYEYDVFRNDTYKSLIELLTDERRKLPIASDADFINDVRQAGEIRRQGLAAGEQKRYEEASKILGESTSAYKRAVRRTGIQIID